MSRRKANKNRIGPLDFDLDIGPGVDLDESKLRKGMKEFTDWHWGIAPKRVIDWKDDRFPDVIECGQLVRLQFRAPRSNASRKHPRRERDAMIQFSKQISGKSHIAYDPDHPHQRLYLLVSPQALPTLKERFWTHNGVAPISLSAAAKIAGGRHGRRSDYPDIEVKPIGVLTAVVYYTHKKGDEGPADPNSHYIHQVGELTRYYPFLCCASDGTLWLAGGNYTTPTPGITD